MNYLILIIILLMNKSKKAEDNGKDKEKINIAEELDNYLKLNKHLESSNHKQSDNTFDSADKELNEQRKRLLSLYDEKDIDKIYDFANKLINSSKSICSRYNDNKASFEKENTSIRAKLDEKEKYNKILMEKIKIIHEEKEKILYDENNKRIEVVKKCEDFMKDVEEKLKAAAGEREQIINENNELREKLKDAAKFIQDNLEASTSMKADSIRMEQELKGMMQGKLLEATENAQLLYQENINLKSQISLYTSKFEEVNKSMQKYSSVYDSLKKEIENRNVENAYLTKKFEDMKAASGELSNVKLELEKKEKQLSSMMNLNRTLSEQVKAFKEKEKTTQPN